MIREATVADVPAIVAMGLRFQATTTYATHLRANETTLTNLATLLVTHDDSVIFLADHFGEPVGMLAASLYTQPMSGEMIGTEVCWWMDPAARGGRTALRLLKTAEAWAKDRGAVVFQMMAPTAQVCALYERLGFDAIELHYQRRIA